MCNIFHSFSGFSIFTLKHLIGFLLSSFYFLKGFSKKQQFSFCFSNVKIMFALNYRKKGKTKKNFFEFVSKSLNKHFGRGKWTFIILRTDVNILSEYKRGFLT